jgi:ABC-type transport system involved in multi-copper enzyme maturation permease subunit
VIATRELREKGRLFTLALILAALPFLMTLVPAMRGWGNSTLIGFFGGMLGVALGLGLAIALGASVIGRELTDKRLSFYFARPLSPASIWIGKAAAGIFTAFACFAIIAVPALIVSRDVWGTAWMLTQPQFVAAVAAGVVVLFLVSHALSTMVRSRSALLGLDIAFIVATGFVLVSLEKPLLLGEGMLMSLRLGAAVLAALTLVLAAGPVWQLAKGRADVRRNHAALSRFVWTGVAVVLLAAAAFVWWVVTPSASDIVRGTVVQAPGGRWLHVHGETKHRGDYIASFLVDTRGGTRLRGLHAWVGPVFSRDGRIAVMGGSGFVPPKRNEDLTLYVVNLADAKPKLHDTRIAAAHEFALSNDGGRLMTIDRGGIVSVHDVARQTLLVSARGLESDAAHAVMFVTPDLVRIWQFNNARTNILEIFELDVRRKSLVKTGQSAINVHYRGLTANADGSRVLLNEAGLLIDGRTGATLRQLPTGRRMGGAILSDGTIVLVERGAGKVHVFDPNGNPLRQVSIPAPKWVRIGAELDGGRIALTTVNDPRLETAYIIDVKRGAIVHQLNGSHVSMPWHSIDPRLPLLGADTDVALASVGGGIALWDMKTGQRKPL